jgi:hypothetical protein
MPDFTIAGLMLLLQRRKPGVFPKTGGCKKKWSERRDSVKQKL